MIQDPAQAGGIDVLQHLKCALAGTIKTAVFCAFLLRLQEAGAHHRSGGQRNHHGDGHGRAKSDGELRNNRPTMPPIRRIGINTAISEVLIESTVNPISPEPWRAASSGAMPAPGSG